MVKRASRGQRTVALSEKEFRMLSLKLAEDLIFNPESGMIF